MGIIIRQSLKASIFSYIGILIGFFNVLFLYPKFLGQVNIGIVETIKAIVLLLAPFALFGSTSAIIRFFPTYAKNGKDDGFYLSLGLIFSLWFVLFLAVFLVFKNELFALIGYDTTVLKNYTWLVFPALISWVLFHFFSTISTSSMRITVPRMMDNVLLRLITLVLVVSFGFSFITLNTLIILMSVAYIVPAILTMIYVLKQKMIKWKINQHQFKWHHLQPILKYSWYVVFGTASSIIIQKIDIVMIGIKENINSVGIYVIAFYIGSVIEIPKRNISDISFPILATAFKEKNTSLIANIYKKTSINQFLIGSFLLIIVWSCLDNLFALMPDGDVYSQGKYVVLFIGIAKLFDMLMGVNNQIIQASDFYRYNLYTNISLSVMVVVFNLIFIPLYSIEGAAFASMLAVIIYNIVSYFVVWNKLKIQPLTKQTVILFVITCIVFGIGTVLPNVYSPIISILIKGFLLSLIFGVTIYLAKVSPQANELIRKSISTLKK